MEFVVSAAKADRKVDRKVLIMKLIIKNWNLYSVIAILLG